MPNAAVGSALLRAAAQVAAAVCFHSPTAWAVLPRAGLSTGQTDAFPRLSA